MLSFPDTDIDILDHELAIRLGFFFGIFLVMAFWEKLAPRRKLTTKKKNRWFSNLGIVALNNVMVRVLIPVLPVGVALLAEEKGWGLLSRVSLPFWLAIIIGVVVLDFIIYLQHVLFHKLSFLWRLHLMHHTDLDIDVSSGLRFHPVEILISLGIKLGAIVLLGPPAVAVLIFEVVLNGMAMFNHANVRIPQGVDRILRLFVVTPDMHRVHHSVIFRENQSNFGFNLSLWDHLL